MQQPATTPKKRAPRKKVPAHAIDELYEDRTARGPKKIDRTTAQKKLSWIAVATITLFLVTALAWLGFYLIGNKNHFDDSRLDLSIDAPAKIMSGDPLDVVIHYQNNAKVQLANASVRFKPPEGFVLTGSDPKANGSDEYHFILGTLGTGDGGQITMHGIFYGLKDDEKQSTLYFDYRPENFNADFEKVLTKSVRASDVPVSLKIDASGTQAGAPSSYVVTVQNTSPQSRGPFKLHIAVPEDFSVSASAPALDTDNALSIPTIAAGGQVVETVQGTYKSSAQGDMKVTATLNATQNDKEYPQVTAEWLTHLSAAPVVLDIQLGDTKKKGSIAPGDIVQTHASVVNNGTAPISDVVLTMEVEAPSNNNASMISWDKVNDPWNGTVSAQQLSPDIRAATITWTKKQIPALGTLQPNQPLIFVIDLPIKTLAQFGANKLPSKSIVVNLSATYPGGAPISTAPIELTFRTDAKLSGASSPAGDPVHGKGPDGVTEVTTRQYDVTWSLANSLHELGAIEFTCTLPPGVEYDTNGSVPAGSLSYVDSTRTIRFTLNKLPTTIPSLSFGFRVHTVTAVGDPEPATLTGEATLTANDNVTKDIFVVKSPGVTRK